MYKTVAPDQLESMHKKATFIVERITNELGSDEYLYPSKSEHEGFSNLSTIQYAGFQHEGETKFCTLFASRLNRMPGTNINCEKDKLSVTSIEGIDWYLPVSDFRDNDEVLIADVNGETGPNCQESDNCPRPDRFVYKIKRGIARKTTKKEYYDPTTPPPAHTGPAGGKDVEQNKRPGLKQYSIMCYGPGKKPVTGATILGVGAGKVNGNYMLVAIPNAGYSCSWFTQQVTVKDANVDDCEIECSKNLKRPECDQEPCSIVPTPPPAGDDDDDDSGEESKTYCIDINVTGESGKCIVEGAGCKVPGTYDLTITPTDNYTYNGSTSPSNYKVIVSNKDVNVTINCEPPAPDEESSDPCCEKEFGTGAKYIAKSNACIKDLGVTNDESVDCGKDKTYCVGNWAYWNHPAIYPTVYKTCLGLNMDTPSKAKFLELYNNRQSVFAESNWYGQTREAGYYTNESTRYLPDGDPNAQYNGIYVWQYVVHVPYDNQVHSIAPRNTGARGLCWAPAPEICKSSGNSDSGLDDGSINAVITSSVSDEHKSSLNYNVTWTFNNPPLSQGKKYKVTAYDWVGTLLYTYYGVTTTTNGSKSGTITGIPSRVPSNWVKLSVSFY